VVLHPESKEEEETNMKFIIKPTATMYPYIAVHRKMSYLPKRFHSMPCNAIFVRRDIWDERILGIPARRIHLKGHEYQEQVYLRKGLNYRESHWRSSLLWP
jgi:hypothetical protein